MFEDVVFHLAHGGLLDTIEHPNQRQYPGQRIFIVNVEGYACLVPFAEGDKTIFLKTIIPSRKMRKDKRVNIRMAERDFVRFQKTSVQEGLPYQTLLSSILHKYINGRLVEKTGFCGMGAQNRDWKKNPDLLPYCIAQREKP